MRTTDVASADEIPVAHTPTGGYGDAFPAPVLAGCTEPLVEGAPDLRGHWKVVEVEVDGAKDPNHPVLGHEQRIEQCGNRLVVTAAGIIHDMRCDGTDADNYAPFAATLTEVLKKITSGAPKAKILIVSSPWATVQNYGQVAAQLPGPRAANSGTGPCDQFDPSGKPVPAHWRTLEGITLHYLGELKSACAKFPACQYDNDALYHMKITTDDITTSDGFHLTIAGLRKQAALELRVLGLGS